MRPTALGVLGNHDHYTDPELTTRPATPSHRGAEQPHTTIRRGPDSLQLSGIDDWSWNATNWDGAFSGLKARHPRSCSHQPAVLDFEQTNKVALILSGHTHGGQINPVARRARAFATKDLKYARGLFRRGETQLYVSTEQV